MYTAAPGKQELALRGDLAPESWADGANGKKHKERNSVNNKSKIIKDLTTSRTGEVAAERSLK